MEHFLAIDIGTTSVKVCLFDACLRLLGSAVAEYSLLTPGSDIVEVQPEVYFDKITECLCDMRLRELSLSAVRRIVVTTQGETLIPVGHDGAPLYNAIVWLDNRASAEAAFLLKEFTSNSQFYRVTGLPTLDGFSPAAKLLYIKNHEPAVFRNTYKFMLLEDYILWHLTGVFATERTLLSSTGFYDIERDTLWVDMLSAIGVAPSMIPDAYESGRPVGCLTHTAADALGLPHDVLVLTGAMDQICSAIGCGNILPGVVHETTGTAMVIGTTVQKPSYSLGEITLYRHVEKGNYLLIPIGRTASVIQKWFKEQFCMIETAGLEQGDISSYEYLSSLAARSVPGANGLVLLPYFSGSIAPVSAERLRGAFLGIGLHTRKEDFVRAIYEGIAFMLRENIELIARASVSCSRVYSTGGAAKSDLWCQIKADVTGKAVYAAQDLETTAFGAACLAAVEAGCFPDLIAAAASYNTYTVFLPNSDASILYDGAYYRYCDALQALMHFE